MKLYLIYLALIPGIAYAMEDSRLSEEETAQIILDAQESANNYFAKQIPNELHMQKKTEQNMQNQISRDNELKQLEHHLSIMSLISNDLRSDGVIATHLGTETAFEKQKQLAYAYGTRIDQYLKLLKNQQSQ